jgi:hypothetical protein
VNAAQQPPWHYVWDGVPRPFVHPLSTPAGHVLSREAPQDHPWHHALWFTIKFVDGDNFWEELPPFGSLVHAHAPTITGDTVAGTLDWVRPDGSLALRSRRTLAAHPVVDGTWWALDWTEELLAGPHEVVLDRTPFEGWGGYGGLTLRGAGEWTDTTLMLDDGTCHDRVLGVASRWCALRGTVRDGPDDGARVLGDAGIVICDHPDNPQAPVPFYASTRAATYGQGWSNFCNAAFLWSEPMTLAPDSQTTLRYRVLVHDGIWDVERCEAAWRTWVEAS